MPTGTLGCGQYDAYIMTRGGIQLIAEFPWNQLTWGRSLDDTSQATLVGAAADCCGLLSVVRPWRHEVAIFRNGVLVWVGPVYNPNSEPDDSGPSVTVNLAARDLSAWWSHRLIHEDHDYSTLTDLATIFQAYATDAMAPDNTPGLTVSATPCGILGSRTALASQHLVAGDELSSIAEVGIDWTMFVRECRVGGLVIPTDPIATLTDEHFMLPPVPNLDGSAQANRWVVVGSGTDDAGGNAVFGDEINPDAAALDGLLESTVTDTTILDNPSAQSAAGSRLALTTMVLGVEQAILAPNAPVDVDELVCGALCRLELQGTCPPISGMFRLSSLSATAQTESDAEQITCTFQPEGTTVGS